MWITGDLLLVMREENNMTVPGVPFTTTTNFTTDITTNITTNITSTINTNTTINTTNTTTINTTNTTTINTTTAQPRFETGSDLPLTAIISGVIICVIFIAVLIYTTVCSHRSSRRSLYVDDTQQQQQRAALMRDTVVMQEAGSVQILDFANVAFSETFDLFSDPRHARRSGDQTFAEPNTSLNNGGGRAGERTATGMNDCPALTNRSKDDCSGLTNKPKEEFAVSSSVRVNGEDGDGVGSQCGGDEVTSEARGHKTWLMGSVDLDSLDVSDADEKPEDGVTTAFLSLKNNGPSRGHKNSQAESNGNQDWEGKRDSDGKRDSYRKRESDDDSDIQFFSCSEGDELSLFLDNGATGDATIYKTPQKDPSPPDQSGDVEEAQEQEEETKQLLLREEISRVTSSICLLASSMPSRLERDELGAVSGNHNVSAWDPTGSIREPRKVLPNHLESS